MPEFDSSDMNNLQNCLCHVGYSRAHCYLLCGDITDGARLLVMPPFPEICKKY